MVDNLGRWTYCPGEPAKTHCDMDTVADIVTKDFGFMPTVLSIEEFCEQLYAFFKSEADDHNAVENPEAFGYGPIYDDHLMLVAQTFKNWVSDNLPLSDFDYES